MLDLTIYRRNNRLRDEISKQTKKEQTIESAPRNVEITSQGFDQQTNFDFKIRKVPRSKLYDTITMLRGTDYTI